MTNRGLSTDERLRGELEKLAGEGGFVHYLSLFRLKPEDFQAIGLFAQLAATIDLHIRRIFFALRAKGTNERGPERAHLDQIFERLPEAVTSCEHDLYRKEEFPALLAVLQRLLKPRNDIIHSACRWQPDGDIFVFAHANEKAGRDIKTGEGIAYWLISRDAFLDNVAELEEMSGYVSQYSWHWLPKLRPWLENYWDGKKAP